MAITYQSVSPDTSSTGNVASLTSGTFTVSGSNKCLFGFMGAGAGTPAAHSGMKWQGSGGTALTQIGSSLNIGANARLSAWRLIAPADATDTIYGLYAANQDETAIGGVQYTGVDQTTPVGTPVTQTGTFNSSGSTNINITITTAVGDVVLAAFFVLDNNGNSPLLTPGGTPAATGRYEIEGAQLVYEAMQVQEVVATGTSTTVTCAIAPTSGTANGDWGAIAFVVAAAAGGGGVNNTVSVDESLSVSDNVVCGIRKGRTIDELLTVVDDPTIYRIYEMIFDEQYVVGDDVLVGKRNGRTIDEQLAVIDELIAYRRFTRLLDDALSIVDLLAVSITSGGIVYTVSLDDLIAVIDDLQVTRKFSRMLDDAISVIDDVQAVRGFRRTLDELVDVNDLLARTISSGGTIYAVLLDDALVVYDEQLTCVSYTRRLDDTVTVSDDALIGALRTRVLDDGAVVTDTALYSINRMRGIDDLLDVMDDLGSSRKLTRMLSESLDFLDLLDATTSGTAPIVTADVRIVIGAQQIVRLGADQSIRLGGYN